MKISLGHTLIINKKSKQKCARKNHANPGKKKRKTTGQQSAIRSTKKSLPSTCEISSRPTKRQKKQFDRNDPANICGVCEENFMMTLMYKMLKGGSSVLFANCGFMKLVQECMKKQRTILYVPIVHEHQR